LIFPEIGHAQESANAGKGVHLGIVRTLFRDASEPLMRALTQPLGLLIKLETGHAAALTTDDDAIHLGKDLAEGKVQIGVFQGIEFAWAQAKYPQLKPLVIVTDGKPFRRAYLVVNAQSPIRGFAGIHEPLAMPLFSHEQCYEFVRQGCQKAGVDAGRTLAKMTRPENAEDALDDVVDGHCQAVIVEEMALDCYRQRKPGRFANLRVAQKSPKFPASVVAYCPGRMSPALLHRFRDILLHASRTTLGRQVLTLWRVTDFESVPADYENQLKEIVKQYPAHAPSEAQTARQMAGR
jgi:ABC-type phosphate/phosphonate transport system substrate-binding protein